MLDRNPLLMNGNTLKLGIFGANCSSGRTYANIPERWVASWENNVRLAQLAEELGLECMAPIARWKGYGGETNTNGSKYVDQVNSIAAKIKSGDIANIPDTVK